MAITFQVKTWLVDFWGSYGKIWATFYYTTGRTGPTTDSQLQEQGISELRIWIHFRVHFDPTYANENLTTYLNLIIETKNKNWESRLGIITFGQPPWYVRTVQNLPLLLGSTRNYKLVLGNSMCLLV